MASRVELGSEVGEKEAHPLAGLSVLLPWCCPHIYSDAPSPPTGPLGFPGRWSAQYPEPPQPAAKECSPAGVSLWMRLWVPQCNEKWCWEIRPGWCPSNSGCKMYTILSYATSITGWGVHGLEGSSRSDCGVGMWEALRDSFWNVGILALALLSSYEESWCRRVLGCWILGHLGGNLYRGLLELPPCHNEGPHACWFCSPGSTAARALAAGLLWGRGWGSTLSLGHLLLSGWVVQGDANAGSCRTCRAHHPSALDDGLVVPEAVLSGTSWWAQWPQGSHQGLLGMKVLYFPGWPQGLLSGKYLGMFRTTMHWGFKFEASNSSERYYLGKEQVHSCSLYFGYSDRAW